MSSIQFDLIALMMGTNINKAEKPKILYIGGFGRSGSTILDMLLGMHPDIFGGGELRSVFSSWEGNKTCSCNSTANDCVFWLQVRSLFRTFLPETAVNRSSVVTRQIESISNVFHLMLKRNLNEEYKRIWENLFLCISKVSDTSVIVDSSKSTRRTSLRAFSLKLICDMDVTLIHLVRDPKAVLWSYKRGNNQFLEEGLKKVKRGGSLRMLASWFVTNLSLHIMSKIFSLPLIHIRYEDLVVDPAFCLNRICKFSGVDTEYFHSIDIFNSKLITGHGIEGNRLRRKGPQILNNDNEWERKLPFHLRILTILTWPLCHYYGYRTFKLIEF